MQSRSNFLPFFLVFFGLSLFFILLGRIGLFENITSIFNHSSEVGRNAVNILSLKSVQNKAVKELMAENARLKKELQDEKNILNENIALKSQFAVSENESQSLIPAKVVGEPGFIPGLTLPEYLIINKGEKQGIKAGNAVVVENYLVGKVVKTYPDISKVELVTNKNSSFTAKIVMDGEINGIIKGQAGEEMIMDNVLLTVELKKDMNVLTKGNKNEKGEGYPPDIIVGKIISVEKKQSDLFQRASVISPLNFKNLEMVFVLK